MNIKEINGGEILVFGDLHFSCVFSGRHKDYFSECCSILHNMTEIIEERKPSAVVLLGDIIGWNETNIKNHEVLHLLLRVFKQWNAICPVYSIRGNHDMKGHPDFNLLNEVGYITTTQDIDGYIDFRGTTNNLRIHFVDYGDEHKTLCLSDSGDDIALCHANLTIQGITNWYQHFEGIELGTLDNFSGLKGIIAGHIHNPSPEFVSTKMPDNQDCWLFYPGSPMRPQGEKYDTCWYVSIKDSEQGIDINPICWELPAYDEVFLKEEAVLDRDSVEIAEELQRKENLQNILSDLMHYHIVSGDPMEQIDKIPYGSDEAKLCAKAYLQKAYNQGK